MKYKRALPYFAVGIAGAAVITGVVANQDSCEAQSCQVKTNQSQPKTQPKSEIEKIQDDLGGGALLLDVRTPEEYAESHAKGAINLPYDQIVAGSYPTKDKDTKIYVYCRSGKRADVALNALKQAGYTNAASLTSLSHWQELGGAVTR